MNNKLNPVIKTFPEDLKTAKIETDKDLTIFKNDPTSYIKDKNPRIQAKLGEIGVNRKLQELGFQTDQACKDPQRLRECDIIIKGPPDLRCEVKTWTDEFWIPWGRCLSIEQIEKVRRKTDIVIWCTTPQQLKENSQVKIEGWNHIRDFDNTTPHPTGPEHRQVINHQLELNKVRNFTELILLIEKTKIPKFQIQKNEYERQ